MDGLPSETVYKTVQDDKGYIWMATSNGLCRYDGRSFKKYTSPELIDNEIVEMLVDKIGRIWLINLSRQLAYLQNDSIHIFQPNATGKKDFIAMWLSEENSLLLLTEKNRGFKRLWQLQLDGIIEHQQMSSVINRILKPVKGIKRNRENQLILINLVSSPSETRLYNDPDIIDFIIQENQSLYQHSTINLTDGLNKEEKESLAYFDQTIFHTWDQNIVHISDQQFYRYSLKQYGVQLIKKVVSFDGKIFIATDKGFFLIRIENKQFYVEQYFSRTEINDIIKDREGNYWLSTNKSGVMVVPSLETLKFDDINTDLPNKIITSITKLNNTLFLGHHDIWLSSIDTNRNIASTRLTSGHGIIRHIIPYQDDKIITASTSKLNIYNDRLHKITSGTPCAIKDLLLDPQNQLWIACHNGLGKNSIEKMPKSQSQILSFQNNYLYSKRTQSICFDQNDRLWIGSIEGLLHWKNNQLQKINIPNISEQFKVLDIVADENQNIWVATEKYGFLHLKDTIFQKQYSIEDGLNSNNCNILFIQENELWIGTDIGLNRLSLDDYSLENLAIPAELTPYNINAIWADSQNIWIGGNRGLDFIPKSFFDKQLPTPLIHIAALRVNQQVKKLAKQYQLAHNQNNIEIEFNGITYNSRGKEIYYYRIPELDTNWIITPNQSTTFNTLEPGTYTFEVMVEGIDGQRSPQAARLFIQIATPWWKKWWARLVFILIVSGIGAGLVIYRQNIIFRRKALQQEFTAQINELKMEALQTQLNPHFIFNTLNAIQDYLLSNDSDAAIDYLSLFAKMIRKVFEFSTLKTISLQEEIDFLQLYLKLEKLRFGDQITTQLKIDPTLMDQINQIDVPPLLLQPIVENAFKHGLHHQMNKGNLSIHFQAVKQDHFRCIIEDNGIGRKRAQQLNPTNFHNKRNSGLKITQSRLDLFHRYNENINEEEYFKIIDLVGSNGVAKGTRVEVIL